MLETAYQVKIVCVEIVLLNCGIYHLKIDTFTYLRILFEKITIN